MQKFLLLTLFLLGCGSNQQQADWAAPKLRLQKANSNTVSEIKKDEFYALDDQIKFVPEHEVSSIYVNSKCLVESKIFYSNYFVENQNSIVLKNLISEEILTSEIKEVTCDVTITVKNLSGSQKLYNVSSVKIIPQDVRIDFIGRTQPMPEYSHDLNILELKITNFLSTPQSYKIPMSNDLRYKLVMLNEGGFVLLTKPVQVPLQFNFENINVKSLGSDYILEIPANSVQTIHVFVNYTSTSCLVKRDRLAGIEFEILNEFFNRANMKLIKNTGTSRLPYFIPMNTINNVSSVEHVTTLGLSGEVLCP